MQLLNIVVYSHHGQVREIPLKKGKLNIISGRSGRGKSALIAIVDYCLGSRNLEVPSGIIQNSVSWFGVLLDFNGDEVFIARPGLRPRKDGGLGFHISFPSHRAIPPVEALAANFSRQQLIEKINGRIGLSSALIPRADGSAERKELSFRSALLYSFQKQNEIANPDLYFHRQSDAGVAQQIRDTLPFYLGAISPDIIDAQAKLRTYKKRLRELDRLIARDREVTARHEPETSYLIAEASRVGLYHNEQVSDDRDALTVLRGIEQLTSLVADSSAEVLDVINARLNAAQRKRSDLKKELQALEGFEGDQGVVAGGINEQLRRLTPLNIALYADGQHICPICEEVRSSLPPTARELQASLDALSSELRNVSRDQNSVSEVVNRKRRQIIETDDEIAAIRSEVLRLREEDESTRILLERRNEAARVTGMISMFLKVSEVSTPDQEIAHELERDALVEEIEQIEAETDINAVRARTATFLGYIGQSLTAWASEQNLEYSDGLLTFDVRGPRLISETERGTVPFSQFGSGHNWVWYHLLGHIALHKWFVERARPVPRFLFLDQPSQVYFPAQGERDEELDWQEVRKIYDWLFQAVDGLKGELQVIVTDHALFPEDARFMEHVVENWWGDEALIPTGWPERPN